MWIKLTVTHSMSVSRSQPWRLLERLRFEAWRLEVMLLAASVDSVIEVPIGHASATKLS